MAMRLLGLAVYGVLLFVCTALLATTSAHAQTPTPVATAQGTPTPNATMAALQEEKLRQEVQQLQRQNTRGWLWTNGSGLIASLLTAAVASFGLVRYFMDRENEREKRKEEQDRYWTDKHDEREKRKEEQERYLADKHDEREKRAEEQTRYLEDKKDERMRRAEEQFQSIVGAMSSGNSSAQVGAAVTLRTFLRPGYEQFYAQIFDLAVSYLRIGFQGPDARAVTSAMTSVFAESFAHARDYLSGQPASAARREGNASSKMERLDARGVGLRDMYLQQADLDNIYLLGAYLTGANLAYARLNGAVLAGADLIGANLRHAYLREAILHRAILERANLQEADLRSALLSEARLVGANLAEAILEEADLNGTDFGGVVSLKQARMWNVKNLTPEQRAICEAKGANFDPMPK
jgi:uncharacterized protein YjbI with pentapeptide repeats